MTKTINTALLAIIAGALALLQLPAAHKFIHNNLIYKVQLAQYEQARDQYKEDVKAYCKEHSSVWMFRNEAERRRQRDFWDRNPGPQRSDSPMTAGGTYQYNQALLDWSYQRPLGPSSIRRSVQGCIEALTEASTTEIRNAYHLVKQTPEFKGKRAYQI